MVRILLESVSFPRRLMPSMCRIPYRGKSYHAIAIDFGVPIFGVDSKTPTKKISTKNTGSRGSMGAIILCSKCEKELCYVYRATKTWSESLANELTYDLCTYPQGVVVQEVYPYVLRGWIFADYPSQTVPSAREYIPKQGYDIPYVM